MPGEGKEFIPRYFKGKFDLHQRAYALIPNEKVDGKFFYYSLLYSKDHFSRVAVGSTVKSLRLDSFRSLSIQLPPLKEQRQIACVLSSFDDKIELNRQTNQTLEAIAQAIFKEWFVDFNYPGATGELVDSPLGPIPKGWRVGKLGELVKISSGKGLAKSNYTEEGYPVLGANGIIGFTDNFLSNEEVILTGRVGTLGTFQLVNREVWISDNVLIMMPIEKENYFFSYFFIKTVDFQNLNRGSTQPLVTKTDLLNLEVLIPPTEQLIEFDSISRSLYNMNECNNQQTLILSEIRDALLPKLMNQEIEI